MMLPFILDAYDSFRLIHQIYFFQILNQLRGKSPFKTFNLDTLKSGAVQQCRKRKSVQPCRKLMIFGTFEHFFIFGTVVLRHC